MLDARDQRIDAIRRQIQSGEYRGYLDRHPDVLDLIVESAAQDVLREEFARAGEELPPVLVGQGAFVRPYWPKPAPSKFFRGFAIALGIEAVVAVLIAKLIGWI